MPEVDLQRSLWDDLDPRTLHDIVRLRVDVFVVEQECAYPELDGRDVEPSTEHWWTADDTGPTSYLRVLTEPDGSRRIGRVVTRHDVRGAGLGGRLMDEVMRVHGGEVLVLDAQVYIQKYYAARGFKVSGPEYLDDGIPHVPMRRPAGGALPRSAPRTQGVDAPGVQRFLDAVEAHPEVEMHGLVVLRHGQVVVEGWWTPYSAERVHLLYSLSKSFTSSALGLAIEEGLVSLDDTVLQHLPAAGPAHEVAHDPSLRHLAAMASGHTTETWDRVTALRDDEPVRTFLRLAPDGEPGTTFAYNQSCTYSIAAVLQQVTGRTLTEYLRPRLLDPLGIGEVIWQQHPQGRDLGFSGLHARTEDVARLGLLHLQGGRFEDRQVLPGAWVSEATRPHVSTAGEDDPDWAQGYGYQFWAARHGYRGDGAYGQFCVVLPEQDSVVAITGASIDMQAVLDAAWEHLLPALSGDPSTSDDAVRADADLADRTASLTLPTVLGSAEPDDRNRWDRAAFVVHPGDGVPSGLNQVQVSHDGRRWRFSLDEPDGSVVADLGTSGWRTTEHASATTLLPVATTGGWQSDGTLEAVLALLETPHSVRLRLDPATGTADVRWVTAPLHGSPLSRCAAPRA